MTRTRQRSRTPTGYFGGFSQRTYTLLTTFRRDGSPVRTPVHVVASPDGENGYFRTWHTTGKAKRLRRNGRVELAPSTFRGRRVGPGVAAQARLLEVGEAQHAAELLASRHPILHGVLIPRYHRLRGWRTLHYELTSPQDATTS